MKIELTCPHCDSILRVDAEHAGKQLRCPNCQNLAPIPNTAPMEPAEPTKYSSPVEDVSQPPPVYVNSDSPGQSQRDIMSLVFGIAGIIMNLGCGCLVPFFVILNIIGLVWAVQSSGPTRTACLATNLIALGIAVLRFFSMLVWGAININ